MVFLTAVFARVFPEKQLELKSLKGQTKIEEFGARLPNSSVSVCPERLFLWFEPFFRKTRAKRWNRGGTVGRRILSLFNLSLRQGVSSIGGVNPGLVVAHAAAKAHSHMH
jgi:hypothetical protein